MACEIGSLGPKYAEAQTDPLNTTRPETSSELHSLHDIFQLIKRENISYLQKTDRITGLLPMLILTILSVYAYWFKRYNKRKCIYLENGHTPSADVSFLNGKRNSTL